MKKNIVLYIFSILFSIAIALTMEIGNYNEYPSNFIYNFHFSFALVIKILVISIIIFILGILLFKGLDRIKLKKSKPLSNKYFIIIFIGQVISGLIFLLTYYPAQTLNDTLYILHSPINMTIQHPLLYNLLIYIPYTIFNKLFHNTNLSFFLLSLCQLLLISAIVTFIIWWFNKTFKSKIITIILSLYFIFVPIITNYNIALVKDSIFNIILLMLIPIIYNIISSDGEWLKKKKNIIITIIICSLTALIRNNGLYIIIFCLIILLIKYRKHYENFLFILSIVLIISVIPNIFNKTLFQEKVGIPMQQMAYTYYIDGKMNKKEEKYLDKWFRKSTIKDYYSPYTIDTIKWNADFDDVYFNNNKKEFINTYISLLKKNPRAYVKGYLLATYGNWNLKGLNTGSNNLQSRFLGLDETDKEIIAFYPNLHRKRIFPKKVQNTLEKYYDKTTTYFSSGMCLWILLFFISYIIYKKKYNLILLVTPIIGNFITLMLSTPLSTAFRYSSNYAYILPFFIFIILLEKEKTD